MREIAQILLTINSLMSTDKAGGLQDNVSEAMKKLSIADIAKQSSSTTMEPTVPQSSLDNSEGTSSSSISMQDRKDLKTETINYDAQRMIGHGSFGAVFLAKAVETGEMVAIKKVLQDRRFKNRELQIMVQLSQQPHPYIVSLKHHFTTKGQKSSDEVYLNLVLEFVPETIYSISKIYNRRKEAIPTFSIKLYMYQLARALGHIHGMGICHRDIKPHNLLVDPVKQVLKLCDFGSAKAFVKGEPNVAYICSRFYRAPELIFGATDYTCAIDVWSHGCVFAELMLGSPIFPGSSGVDQLVEIIKILGTPTKEQVKSMNPNYQEFKFPEIRAHPWGTIFKPSAPADAVDLVGKMLEYVPEKRMKAVEACVHPFFNELRLPSTTLTCGSAIPEEMFKFTEEEMLLSPQSLKAMIPPHLAGADSKFTSGKSG